MQNSSVNIKNNANGLLCGSVEAGFQDLRLALGEYLGNTSLNNCDNVVSIIDKLIAELNPAASASAFAANANSVLSAHETRSQARAEHSLARDEYQSNFDLEEGRYVESMARLRLQVAKDFPELEEEKLVESLVAAHEEAVLAAEQALQRAATISSTIDRAFSEKKRR